MKREGTSAVRVAGDVSVYRRVVHRAKEEEVDHLEGPRRPGSYAEADLK